MLRSTIALRAARIDRAVDNTIFYDITKSRSGRDRAKNKRTELAADRGPLVAAYSTIVASSASVQRAGLGSRGYDKNTNENNI